MWKWWVNGQTGLSNLPGEQTMNNVLNADLVSVLALVIVLLVVAVIVVAVCGLWMMYFNSKGISTLATTQQNMSNANAQWAASDTKKTEALNRSVDELTLLRQDFATSSIQTQRLQENTHREIKEHEAKSDERVKAINDHVSAMRESMTASVTDIVGEAVKDVNAATQAATIEAVKPALDALDGLRILGDTISTRQEASMDLLRQQHEAQIQWMNEQNAIHTRVFQDEITRAQHLIMERLKITQEKQAHETPSHTPAVILVGVDTQPDRAAALADGGQRPGSGDN